MKPIEDYNTIADDNSIKFTMNIPKELYHKLCVRTHKGTKYLGRKGPYIRDLLEAALSGDRLPSQPELMKLNRGEVTKPSLQYQLWWGWHQWKKKHIYHNVPAVVEGPPKRFHGFIDGLQYWPLYRRWKNKQDRYRVYMGKKSLDKVNFKVYK
jgi:hypothetical protein